jgi:hypothetical protein
MNHCLLALLVMINLLKTVVADGTLALLRINIVGEVIPERVTLSPTLLCHVCQDVILLNNDV